MGSVATSGPRRYAIAMTKTALVRTGSAFEEKKGAKSTTPLTRIMARVMAARNVGQSVKKASS